MPIQRLDPEKFFQAYGIQVHMLYPWEGVVEPPFGAAWSVARPGETTKHHAHQEGETFIFLRGQGFMRVGEEAHEVKAGDVVFQPPFNAHTLVNTSETEDLVFISLWWEDLALWAGREKEAAAKKAAVRPKRAMVCAAPPTANGDLHVGHLSGPYIAGDLHTRYLKLRGVDARYILGTDDNWSYVKTNGLRMGLGPQEAADHVAGEIAATLAAAGIEIEELMRPNASPWHVKLTQEFFRRLHDNGHLVAKEVSSPYCEDCDLYLYEAYIRGRCPNCGASSGGNICEDCGRPNDTSELLDPLCTQCGKAPGRRTFTRLFFPLSRWEDQLKEFHRRVDMGTNLRTLCEQIIAHGLPDMTVTHVSDWGIPVPIEGFEGQTINVLCELAPYYFSCAQHLGGWEAYFRSDEAEMVHFIGFDNGFHYAVFLPALYMAFDPELQQASAFITNQFYRLDDLKFSTSRRHAIWGRELLADVPADVVRFYLSYTAPEVERTNFTVAEFEEVCDRELGGAWQSWLAAVGDKVRHDYGGKVPATGDWMESHRRFYHRLEALAAEAATAYEAATFSRQRAARVLCELVREARYFSAAEASWSKVPDRSEERRTVMALELLAAKLLAVMASPMMPEFAERLWRGLGYEAPVKEQRWEDRPSWVPAGQQVGSLGEPYFPSIREAMGARKQRVA
ncbi:MAG TPA: class I tRNA ligase family protein [Thermoanaerobaculia bacterium]|jgi:methionyl-tRNA synthetase|nr:class I tRNA ligase family protein [Thermoanaerobaculia bacterium]